MKTKAFASVSRTIKRAFTLVELLVVVGVIAILLGLMTPAIAKAKAYAQTTACKNNLRELGVAFTAYTGDYGGYAPIVAAMPSLNLNDYPRLCDVLSQHVNGSSKVFKCPADRGAATTTAVSSTYDEDGVAQGSSASSSASGKSDFENEGSSYEFNEFLCGRKIKLLSRAMLMHDYRTYHGKPGTPGASNYLFEDGHVGDF